MWRHQLFNYVQANPPVVAGAFISRQLGALSASVLLTQQKNHSCAKANGRRGIGL